MKIWIKYLIPKFGKQNNSVNKESKIEVIRIKAKNNEVEKRKIALSLSQYLVTKTKITYHS